MRTPDKTNRLLNEVLNEGDYPHFREQLLATMIGEARSRQRRRWAAPAVAVAAGLTVLLAAIAAFHSGISGPARNETALADANPGIASGGSSGKQAGIEIIETQTGLFEEVAALKPPIPTVSDLPPVPTLSDEELLAQFPGIPRGLMVASPTRKVFFLAGSEFRSSP